MKKVNVGWQKMAIVLSTLVFFFSLPGSAGAWSYKEAARPYAGKTITVLDEITPLQEVMKKIVPEFVKETGINVNIQLLNHFEVIEKGQADMLSGAGAYDGVMLHSAQMGLLLKAGVIRPIDDLMANVKLKSPTFDTKDLIQPAWDTLSKFQGKRYGLLNWNYNQVYWARADLIKHPDEKTAFKKRYGYELAPAETMQQMRDIAEFFTRKKGEKLAGETLQNVFYGIVLEGLKFGTLYHDVWNNYLRNWGGGMFDANGKPNINSKENIAAVKFWASLWKFSPPGQAEYSLIDIPTVMGNGIAAQTIAWSDFILGIDNPEKSKFAGKFAYRGIPKNANFKGPRSAETEPSFIVISKSSKNPEATYLFLQWLDEKSTQERMFEVGGAGVPVLESSWNLPVLKNSKYAELYSAMHISIKSGQAKPKVPKHYQFMDLMGGVLQEIGMGKKTVEDGLGEAQQKALQICDDCVLK
jgi:multiple sugar transport system substrate-binding protein